MIQTEQSSEMLVHLYQITQCLQSGLVNAHFVVLFMTPCNMTGGVHGVSNDRKSLYIWITIVAVEKQ
jgi:hypothetical protein